GRDAWRDARATTVDLEIVVPNQRLVVPTRAKKESALLRMVRLAELWVLLQSFPRLGRQLCLLINRPRQRFGAGRTTRALEPMAIQRFVDQLRRVGGNGGFLLLSCRVSGANSKAGQQQRHTKHRAARIGRQRAGTLRV